MAGLGIPHHPDPQTKHLAGSRIPRVNGILQNDSAACLGGGQAPSQNK